MVCRRCRARFRVTTAGVQVLDDSDAPVAAPAAAAGPSQDVIPTVTGAAVGAVARDLPEGATAPSPAPQAVSSGLADALEPEPADEFLQTVDFEEVDGVEPPQPAAELTPEPPTSPSAQSWAPSSARAPEAPVSDAEEGDAPAAESSGMPSDLVSGDSAGASGIDLVAATTEPHASAAPSFDAPELAPPDSSVAIAAGLAPNAFDDGEPTATDPRAPSAELDGELAPAVIDTAADELPQPVELRAAVPELSPGAEVPHDTAIVPMQAAPVIDASPATEASSAEAQTGEPAGYIPPREMGGGFETPTTAEIRRLVARPAFPRAAFRSYLSDWGGYFSSGTLARKLVVVVMLALPFALVALGAMSLLGPRASVAWVNAPTGLWSGPAADEGFGRIDTLARGEQLMVVARDAEFAMVRDIFGRVGFVSVASLVDASPAIAPDASFPGCRASPLEDGEEACKQRAQGVLSVCREGCGADASCGERCSERFVECLDGCKLRPASSAASRPLAGPTAPPAGATGVSTVIAAPDEAAVPLEPAPGEAAAKLEADEKARKLAQKRAKKEPKARKKR